MTQFSALGEMVKPGDILGKAPDDMAAQGDKQRQKNGRVLLLCVTSFSCDVLSATSECQICATSLLDQNSSILRNWGGGGGNREKWSWGPKNRCSNRPI